jgi:hypothetical protein
MSAAASAVLTLLAAWLCGCAAVQITKLAVEDGGGLSCSAADAVMSLL